MVHRWLLVGWHKNVLWDYFRKSLLQDLLGRDYLVDGGLFLIWLFLSFISYFSYLLLLLILPFSLLYEPIMSIWTSWFLWFRIWLFFNKNLTAFHSFYFNNFIVTSILAQISCLSKRLFNWFNGWFILYEYSELLCIIRRLAIYTIANTWVPRRVKSLRGFHNLVRLKCIVGWSRALEVVVWGALVVRNMRRALKRLQLRWRIYLASKVTAIVWTEEYFLLHPSVEDYSGSSFVKFILIKFCLLVVLKICLFVRYYQVIGWLYGVYSTFLLASSQRLNCEYWVLWIDSQKISP